MYRTTAVFRNSSKTVYLRTFHRRHLETTFRAHEIFLPLPRLGLLLSAPHHTTPGAIRLHCNAPDILATLASKALDFRNRIWQKIGVQSPDRFVAILGLALGVTACGACHTIR